MTVGTTRALACLGALAAVCVPSYATIDPRPPPPASLPASAPLAAPPPPSAPEVPPDALARLVNIHTGDTELLGPGTPTEARMAALVADRITGESHTIAPRLLDVLRALAKRRGFVRIELVSGYRSQKLNEQLRKKERRVASHSQHSLGHALDFRVEGMTPKEMRKEIEALGWKGGIGQYDKPEDRFVHVDVGPDRRWRGK